MSRTLRVSNATRDDLDEIWFYIARDKPEAADRFVEQVVEKFQALQASPGLGRRRDDLVPGVYSFAFKNYLIFYRWSEDLLEIVRVIHSARDLEALLSQKQP